jgi:hypothetical protein
MRRRAFAPALAAFAWPLRARAVSAPKADRQAGRRLREMILATTAKDLGLTPSAEFPRVCGVVMDWPLENATATIVSLADGTASLYTTSSFGIIGGGAHDAVRRAARRFVGIAETCFDGSRPVTAFPYPAADRIAFYLLCYDGVRAIETALGPVQAGTGAYAPLFDAGQVVLTQLRKTT